MSCYALVTAELSRGWMSLAGAMGGHTVVAKLILTFGTGEQKDRYLPRMATGELRATMALTEPGGGSDLQNLTTSARLDGAEYVINGSKTWISNARRSGLIALLCKTDPTARPRHKGISVLLVEHGPGLTVSRDLPKLGYKGIESCEVVFDDMRVPADAVLGGTPGTGFAQMMKGLETGRIQVASRALGVGQAALDDTLRYAQERESFGKPIWQHQSVGKYLADMVTKLTAARQLVLYAAERFDAGERCDMEAGMAKLFTSEVAMEIARPVAVSRSRVQVTRMTVATGRGDSSADVRPAPEATAPAPSARNRHPCAAGHSRAVRIAETVRQVGYRAPGWRGDVLAARRRRRAARSS
ncbi:MAG: acyl-CoA dehydrogenase family protein [Dehalococcoidia bacterium]